MSDLVEYLSDVPEGFRVGIHYDDTGPDGGPRDWTQLGVMVCEHSRYALGDPDDHYERGDEVERAREALNRFAQHTSQPLRAFRLWARMALGTTVVLPLYLLDHSGLSMSAGGAIESSFDRRNRFIGDEAGWDTSTVGVIFDTAKTREATGVQASDVEAQLRAEVDEYAMYLRGEWYGFVIEAGETCDQGHEHWDEVPDGSCWGFLGFDWVEQAAREALASHLS